MAKFIKIHENDNVAVALETIAQGETIDVYKRQEFFIASHRGSPYLST